ncbi:MAG: hypothetical protein IJ225_00060 [Solobacterium sp.]|nr:hypothetical protein [Solobacterium sp.]
MRYQGVCPKCNGTDILRIEGQSRAYGAGNNIPVGLSIFSAVLVPRYVCMSCGYSEEWIDPSDLPTLEKKYR